MSDRAFFAKWQVEDLAASAPAAPAAERPRAGRGAKGARIAQGPAAAAGRRAVRMSLAADLDGDGLFESVQLVRTERLAVGPCFGLEVRDDDGSLLWRGPRRVAQPETDPFRFCELDIGVSLPQILGDIDGDGFVELVSPQIQSDVRPVIFRVLRWDGSAFRLVRRAALQADPNKPRSFRWRKRPALDDLWVASFVALEAPGQLRVTVMRMRPGKLWGPSEARLQAAGQGYRLLRWIGQPIGKAAKPKAAGGGGGQAVGTLCDRLWYERNAIYAAKGYCFQTERARRAFPNSCFPPWGKLNRAEQRKVDRIRARERALGCP